MHKFLKKFGAYILAAALFIAAACVYCSPVLGGKKLYAGDVQNYLGASQETREFVESTGEQTFWSGSMFCGMPNYQTGGAHYASDKLLLPLTRLFSHRDNPILMLILYLVCFFFMMRAFGVEKWLSIAGAFAVSLSSYFLVIIPAGHFTKVTTIALCGVILGAFNLIFRKKYLCGAAVTAVFVALAVKPHPQMFYYFFMMLGIMWIGEAVAHIREKRYKDLALATAIFALSVGVGIGTGCANVFANSEYASQTMRGGHSDLVSETGEAPSKGLDLDYATQWSYGIDETMSLLIPGFKGGANSIDVGTKSALYRTLVRKGVQRGNAADFCSAVPMYWGEQPFTAGNVYAGAVVCFLFVLGLFLVKGPVKWALLASTLLSILLSWGHNCMWLTELFFKYFPMYAKFRAVSSILVVAEVAMPLLGFLALKSLADNGTDRKTLLPMIYKSAGITAGICLFFAIFGKALFDFTSVTDAAFSGQIPAWVYTAIVDQRASLFVSDCLRSAVFVILAAGAVWLFAKDKLKYTWLAAVLGVLIVVDMWPVDRRYFKDNAFVSPRKAGADAFAVQDWEAIILRDPGYYRVFNLTVDSFNDSRTSYRLKSIGGYSAAKLRRYNDLIGEHLSKMHLNVIGMLNAKYFVVPGKNGAAEVQLNPYALGNAWFVDRLTVVDGANAESDALNALDLSHEAVLDRTFEPSLPDYSPAIAPDASVVLNSYSPKDLDYTCTNSCPGTLVFSEIYYPYGWKATIDGEKVEHYRVNYLLRAVNVPAGTHNIHFTFDPDSVHKGVAVSIFFIIVMYLMVAAAVGLAIYRKCSR